MSDPTTPNRGDEPAFPSVLTAGFNPGLTKREYFAAMATQGMLFGVVGVFDNGDVSAYRSGPCNSVIVNRARTLADALLAELDREGGGE